MRNSLMDQLTSETMQDLSAEDYHQWKTNWYREFTLAQGTLNTRMTKVRIDELLRICTEDEEQHSDEEQFLLQNIEDLEMPFEKDPMVTIISESSEERDSMQFIENEDRRKRIRLS